MGSARPKPKRLAEKLRQIRVALGLSQNDMLKRLGLEDAFTYTRISSYEIGNNEPPLMILLEYARMAGIHTEALIDDELDLPDKLPADVRHEEIKRKYAARGKKR